MLSLMGFVQGLFEAETGNKLAAAAKKMQSEVVDLWRKDNCLQDLPGQFSAPEKGRKKKRKKKVEEQNAIASPEHLASPQAAANSEDLALPQAAANSEHPALPQAVATASSR